ncbi:MAG: SDR family NAD(P)-dependent oxidoreductase [Bryobacteraceae bacterium]
MTENIKDKVIVITGASSGLGVAAARKLFRLGGKLVLGARRLDRLQALAKELSSDGVTVTQTDVTQRNQVKRLVDLHAGHSGEVGPALQEARIRNVKRCKRKRTKGKI